VTDRPTKAHEQVFLLSKSPRYFYDAVAIQEPQSDESLARRGRGDWRGKEGWAEAYHGNPRQGLARQSEPTGGANKRSVWTVSTKPFAGAHFATFPPDLIEPCVLAGAPPKCCGVCGAPWQRVVERTAMVVVEGPKRAAFQASSPGRSRTQIGGQMVEAPTSRTIGWEATCDHDDDTGRALVLDPFNGAGTTGLVAVRNGRAYVGVELNADYAEMARERIETDLRLGHRRPERAPAPAEGQGTLDLFG
jgi:hypothetical protein